MAKKEFDRQVKNTLAEAQEERQGGLLYLTMGMFCQFNPAGGQS